MTPPACQGENTSCLEDQIVLLAKDIKKDQWRDQTYREVAKSMAANGRSLDALPLIPLIKSPDTKALTIRGIGMEAAENNTIPENLFTLLRKEADKIEHAPSYGIALTYIAMAQALAGDDAGAAQTAADMKNDALKNKAYGETAEIQAEQSKHAEAIKSISYIQDLAFKNKAYKSVSRIYAENYEYNEAFEIASNITNPVMKSEAIQFILNKQLQQKQKGQNSD